MEEVLQVNEKCSFSLSTRGNGIKILRAVDLDILTRSPEVRPNLFSSCKMLGVQMRGEVMNRSISSAKGSASSCSFGDREWVREVSLESNLSFG